MNDTIYDITLADGTKIQTTLNGNNFITDDTVDETILSSDNLSKVTIGDTEYTDMICTNIWSEDGHTRFILREKTAAEKLADETSQNASGITDIQMALAEIYEMITGGE